MHFSWTLLAVLVHKVFFFFLELINMLSWLFGCSVYLSTRLYDRKIVKTFLIGLATSVAEAFFVGTNNCIECKRGFDESELLKSPD